MPLLGEAFGRWLWQGVGRNLGRPQCTAPGGRHALLSHYLFPFGSLVVLIMKSRVPASGTSGEYQTLFEKRNS